jgi:PBP1b-binding outer membrane lipoprotein LpoB
MKKIIILSSLAIATLGLAGCGQIQNVNNAPVVDQPIVNNIDQTNTPIIPDINVVDAQDNYTGSLYQGNYVWGGAMNLAWNEAVENIIHEKIKLNTTDPAALLMTDKLNNSVFNKNDLDEASYYVKSGFGPRTLAEINSESKRKFPAKSFSDLVIPMSDKDFISYAYFLKAVEYKNEFQETDMDFNGEQVKGFCATESKQKENIDILNYESDDRFIIRLKLKDNSDQIILAKGFADLTPQQVVSEINKYNQNNLPTLAGWDMFQSPKLHLDYHREYQEMINKFFANTSFQDYFIGQMFENVKFDMDQRGAKVENEAVIVGKFVSAGPGSAPKIKKFILDKPFWVVMQRTGRVRPYFILGINNASLMQKAGN